VSCPGGSVPPPKRRDAVRIGIPALGRKRITEAVSRSVSAAKLRPIVRREDVSAFGSRLASEVGRSSRPVSTVADVTEGRVRESAKEAAWEAAEFMFEIEHPAVLLVGLVVVGVALIAGAKQVRSVDSAKQVRRVDSKSKRELRKMREFSVGRPV
jgi:hypothetical protein